MNLLPIHPFFLLIPFVFYVNHLWIFGLWRVCYYDRMNYDENGIFWKVGKLIYDNAGEFWSKPVLRCPPCMASIHSTYFFGAAAIITGWEVWMLPLYFLYAICLVGFNWKAI